MEIVVTLVYKIEWGFGNVFYADGLLLQALYFLHISVFMASINCRLQAERTILPSDILLSIKILIKVLTKKWLKIYFYYFFKKFDFFLPDKAEMIKHDNISICWCLNFWAQWASFNIGVLGENLDNEFRGRILIYFTTTGPGTHNPPFVSWFYLLFYLNCNLFMRSYKRTFW